LLVYDVLGLPRNAAKSATLFPGATAEDRAERRFQRQASVTLTALSLSGLVALSFALLVAPVTKKATRRIIGKI
jgi:hypothetical protein